MKLLNVALVVLALLATLGGYLHEKKRLATILALSPEAARDLYERAQLRRERVLIVVTAVLIAGAVMAVTLFKLVPR